MGNLYYTYEGKEKKWTGKWFSDTVLIDEDWVDTMQKHFAGGGYQRLVSFATRLIRNECSVDLTPAQAWVLLNHVTAMGVPLALQDKEADENASIALAGVKNVAGFLAGAVTAPVDMLIGGTVRGAAAVGSTVAKVTKTAQPDPEDEDSSESTPDE